MLPKKIEIKILGERAECRVQRKMPPAGPYILAMCALCWSRWGCHPRALSPLGTYHTTKPFWIPTQLKNKLKENAFEIRN
jgi:hypothetical protein